MTKIEQFQQVINDLIHRQKFDGNPRALYEPISYTLNQGGKRLRPLLTLLACDLFDGDTEKALYPALAVEVFHNFTLVHDDIMDKAPLRRGKETVYKKWNSDIAILSGDTMFAMAYQYTLQTDAALIPDILQVFSKAAIEVCEGQQLDMDFETETEVSLADYLNMIRLKTAVLLGASLEIGAVIAGAAKKDVKAIYDFGMALGMAFQLKDDLLDVYGKQEDFGKMSGGDIAANKKTYLFLKALEMANTEDREKLLALYDNNNGLADEQKIAHVKLLFEKIQVKAAVELAMENYYNEARRQLKHIHAKAEKKEELEAFASFLYKRNY
ncbi:MAG: polyprenyl synthetase family protein [Bacteroidetes bacterium]|nr:polyprenyl synthetase family protein [Bacteroidota bacterium]MBU1578572.1 polyprenyl synthetase family protein [Bacteroidota bacterium]MBU2466053.1 polyprenyl synthetase family protein [Bacteroidota bacterium]MBU2557546.1 polyprenyl synthetase family protein [Bacteroidota bacterium]